MIALGDASDPVQWLDSSSDPAAVSFVACGYHQPEVWALPSIAAPHCPTTVTAPTGSPTGHQWLNETSSTGCLFSLLNLRDDHLPSCNEMMLRGGLFEDLRGRWLADFDMDQVQHLI